MYTVSYFCNGYNTYLNLPPSNYRYYWQLHNIDYIIYRLHNTGNVIKLAFMEVNVRSQGDCEVAINLN